MTKHKMSFEKLRNYWKRAEENGLSHWVDRILATVNENESSNLLDGFCYVDQDFIIKAYNDESICKSVKEEIKILFPEVIRETEEYYKFQDQPIKIPPCGYSLSEIPFRIAESWSQHDKEQLCTSLYMDTRHWEIETSKSQVDEVLLRIRFKRKKGPKP